MGQKGSCEERPFCTNPCAEVVEETRSEVDVGVGLAGDVALVNEEHATRQERHLVINMDINKTIIMSDAVSSKTTTMVANEVLAACSWGRIVDGKWILMFDAPSVLRPKQDSGADDFGEEYVSYAEFVDAKLPGVENKKARMKMVCAFTHGEEGKALQEHVQSMVDQLTTDDGKPMLIVPSFFELLIALKRAKRSFTLSFRTFGADLSSVAEELNQFCEGRHPRYPGVRMDGSDGESDYRLHLSDKYSVGTFHRDQDGFSLVMGTQEQPGEGKYKDAKDKSLHFYDGWPDLDIIGGFDAVKNFLCERQGKCGTIGLRDNFGYWKSQGMTSAGGKVFFYDTRPSRGRHDMFFDDNICRCGDLYIVHPISMDSSVELKPVDLLETHLWRAEPLISIVDTLYFISAVEQLEDAYDMMLTTPALEEPTSPEPTSPITPTTPTFQYWSSASMESKFTTNLQLPSTLRTTGKRRGSGPRSSLEPKASRVTLLPVGCRSRKSSTFLSTTSSMDVTKKTASMASIFSHSAGFHKTGSNLNFDEEELAKF